MYKQLHEKASNYNFYHVRRKNYELNDNLPFHISPTPFFLTHVEAENIEEIGILISNYFKSCIELYNNDKSIRQLLNKGKPPIFLRDEIKPEYLLIRPDLIYTKQGFILCEIETSPFGLGLTALLNESYAEESFKTLVHPRKIQNFFRNFLTDHGEILYSDKTKSYSEQLAYLADKVFSDTYRHWTAKHISKHQDNEPVYRAFYLSEYLYDPQVKDLIDTYKNNKQHLIPSLTPQVEEKALLSFIWDKRYLDFFKNTLGIRNVDKLQKIIPKTLILGSEEFFSESLPVSNILDLAKLTRSKRQYALKVSGFDSKSSWAEGVVFLHELPGEKVKELLENAIADQDHIYILQEFIPLKKVSMKFEEGEKILEMNAGVRITPYYDASTGDLISIKATGCRHTNYIHASTDSINTAVAIK